MQRFRRRLRALSALVVVTVLVASCGNDEDAATDASEGSNPSSTTTQAATADCSGDPIGFTVIASLTGPVAGAGAEDEISKGLRAGLNAVNAECATGRPIEIEICDDKSNPNDASTCGRNAASDGSLALVGSTGLNDSGPAAADLPGIFVSGGNQFDLTNERALSINSGLELILGSVSAAAAAGLEDYVMVIYDSALTRFIFPSLQAMASELGVNMEPLWYPPDTTDFAPIAAQVGQLEPDAIGLAMTSILPMMNALSAQGISAREMPVFTAVGLIPPEVRRELGDAAEGMYVITQQAPPTVTDNEGIALMQQELGAAGLDPDDEDLGTVAVQYWGVAHLLGDALATLTPDQLASLDSDMVFEAAKSLSPIDRPEMAPVDFSAPAYPDIEALAPFRLFSRHAMVVHIEDGEYVPVSEFVDVTSAFDMEFDG